VAHDSPGVSFTLADLHQRAEAIIRSTSGIIVTYRLWREVLRLPAGDPALLLIKAAVRYSPWVRQLEDAQQPDGSWGRFHSQDTHLKTPFRTSEEAIQRALALGLDLSDRVLEWARQYILAALQGRVALSDPPEQNERWPLLVQLILAGRLAQIDPANPALDEHWQYWVEVARRAFASGAYRLEDEAAAYPALSGIQAAQGFLESQYALWILSARPLPIELDRALVGWIWNKPDGIRYVRVNLQNPLQRQIGLWFRSMEILTRFAGWREPALEALNRLWEQGKLDGRWDFGGDVTKNVEFPLSGTWRKPGSRQADHSTWALALLREYYE
jgi:hypothetical protein